MLTDGKHHQSFLRSVQSLDQSFLVLIEALVQLAEAECHYVGKEEILKEFIAYTNMEIAQLQRLILKKNKRWIKYFEQIDGPCFIDGCDHSALLSNQMAQMKEIINSLSLSTEERQEMYELLQENQILYKKRQSLLRSQSFLENDPATRWLSFS
ncbi:hypothetical protein CD798_00685 [Bacillaceae bacterium SAOS 7]|nr:hypothetical protein CD798_00685 [Bacillaceae bacterium SAOS 7]